MQPDERRAEDDEALIRDIRSREGKYADDDLPPVLTQEAGSAEGE